jgi:hypothetical protein
MNVDVRSNQPSPPSKLHINKERKKKGERDEKIKTKDYLKSRKLAVI